MLNKKIRKRTCRNNFYKFFYCSKLCERENKMEDFKVIDRYLMVKMPEEIDHHRSNDISRQADLYILKEQVDNIVFDFEDTRFMDSSGIGIIVGRYQKIACFGGKVFAIHADRQIKRILHMSGLGKIMEIME
ncbi:MAG: anti-sigma factor antagonist [Lachnospiraceae bacterium]|nr:anti-sigma factor antagonist [Lachnospiraceae bacterium]